MSAISSQPARWASLKASTASTNRVSLNGKRSDRPDDTIGIAGVLNGIAKTHEACFNAGGLGIVMADGILPHPALGQIVESYYGYAVST